MTALGMTLAGVAALVSVAVAIWVQRHNAKAYRDAALEEAPRRHPATLPARAQPSTPERSRYGSCRECGAPEMEWCRDGCSLVDRWDYR